MASTEILLAVVAITPFIALLDALITLFVHLRNIRRHNDHREAMDRGFNTVIASTSVRQVKIDEGGTPKTPDQPIRRLAREYSTPPRPTKLKRETEFNNIDNAFDR